MSINILKKGLIDSSTIIDSNGLSDLNQGQISCRIPGNTSHFLIKQALCGFDELDDNKILTSDYNPEISADKMAPPELPLHQAIYNLRPDVKCIIHTHSLNATLFSCLDSEIEPITHDGACFADQTALYKGSSHTILTYDRGLDVAKTLANKKVIFLRNHGVVITGQSIKEATVHAVLLEQACEAQFKMMSVGQPYSIADGDDVDNKKKFNFSPVSISFFYDYLVRRHCNFSKHT